MKIIQSIKEKINNSMEALEERYIDANNVVSVGKSELDTISIDGKTSQNLWEPINDTRPGLGLTISQNIDGSCKLTGMASREWGNIITKCTLKKDTTYTLSLLADDADVEIRLTYNSPSQTCKSKSISNGEFEQVFIPADATDIYCYVSAVKKKQYDCVFYPMLVEGSKPRPWTPSGLTCVDNAEIEVCGKNLLEVSLSGVSSASGDIYSFSNDGMVLTAATTYGGDFIFFNSVKAGSYHYSAKNVANSSSSVRLLLKPVGTSKMTSIEGFAWNDFLQAYVDNNPPIGTVPYNKSFTTNNDMIVGFVFFAKELGEQATVKNPQLEVGNTATPYEPYQGSTLPIDLKGNKLCSLPNGVHDELRMTREGERGHVELVKRTGIETNVYERLRQKYSDDSQVVDGFLHADTTYPFASEEEYKKYAFPESMDCSSIPVGYYTTTDPGVYLSSQAMIFANTKLNTSGEMLAWVKEKQPVCVVAIKPQTIDLGYVDLPALPESTANVWTSTNMPNVDTNVTYTKPPVYSVDTVIKHYLHSLKTQPMIAKGSKAPQDPQKFPVWIDTNSK